MPDYSKWKDGNTEGPYMDHPHIKAINGLRYAYWTSTDPWGDELNRPYALMRCKLNGEPYPKGFEDITLPDLEPEALSRFVHFDILRRVATDICFPKVMPRHMDHIVIQAFAPDEYEPGTMMHELDLGVVESYKDIKDWPPRAIRVKNLKTPIYKWITKKTYGYW